MAFYEVDSILLDGLRKATKITVIKMSVCAKDLKPTVSYRGADKSLIYFNPSAWSDGHCPHTVNITCRGVTGTARIQ